MAAGLYPDEKPLPKEAHSHVTRGYSELPCVAEDERISQVAKEMYELQMAVSELGPLNQRLAIKLSSVRFENRKDPGADAPPLAGSELVELAHEIYVTRLTIQEHIAGLRAIIESIEL